MAKKKTTKKSTTKSSKTNTTKSRTNTTTAKKKKVTKKKTVTKKVASKKITKKPVKKVTKKKVTTKTTSKTENTPKPKSPRKIKTHLSKKELNHYLERLNEKRKELVGDVSSMSKEALHADSTNLSSMPIHMADIGSDAYQQEHTLGLVESEQKTLHEIDEAIQRIANKTYGVCLQTGKKITKARLDAKPWAKYCIEIARELEKLGKL